MMPEPEEPFHPPATCVGCGATATTASQGIPRCARCPPSLEQRAEELIARWRKLAGFYADDSARHNIYTICADELESALRAVQAEGEPPLQDALRSLIVEARRKAPTFGVQEWDWLLERLAVIAGAEGEPRLPEGFKRIGRIIYDCRDGEIHTRYEREAEAPPSPDRPAREVIQPKPKVDH